MYPQNLLIRNEEKGVFRRGVFAEMDASLRCGALSAKCTAGPNVLGYFFSSLGRDTGCCRNPPC